MLVLTLGPQLLLFLGNGMANDDLGGYIDDNWDLVFPIVAGSLVISATIASVGLVVAAYLPRRAYATAAIVGVFVITLAAAHILMETADPHYARFGLLLSPIAWQGMILWLFGVDPRSGTDLFDAGFDGWVYLLAALVDDRRRVRRHAAPVRQGVDVSGADHRRSSSRTSPAGTGTSSP